jgi:hypothetical protein
MWEGLTKKMGQKKQKNKNGSPSAKVGTRGRGSSLSARDKALGEEVPSPSVGSRHSGNFFFVFSPHILCEAFKYYLKLLAQI